MSNSSLFKYVVTETDAIKEHYNKIVDCLKNPYTYGINKLGVEKLKFLGIHYDNLYYRIYDNCNYLNKIPKGLHIQTAINYWTQLGIEDSIEFDGFHVEEFLVLAKTCKVGDTILCTPKLKKFLFDILSGETTK